MLLPGPVHEDVVRTGWCARVASPISSYALATRCPVLIWVCSNQKTHPLTISGRARLPSCYGYHPTQRPTNSL
eukprot:3941981-Rhodomonas_salina.6